MKTTLFPILVAATRQSAAWLQAKVGGARLNRRYRCLVCLALLSAFGSPLSTGFAQGAAFTYQGRLDDGRAPANGDYDLTFTLFGVSSGGSAVAGPLTHSLVAVSNGLFTATLDFGAGVFDGSARWLEIGVRANGGDAFIILHPRQALTPTPYAMSARSVTGVVPSGSLVGAYSSAVTFSNADNRFTGSGAGLSGVNSATLGGMSANQFWRTTGNASTTASNFIGTSDNQPLELRVDGRRALRLQANVFGGPSVIGGSNTVHALTAAAAIAGGQGNDIRENGFYSAVGGGLNNLIDGGQYSLIAGGLGNRMEPGVLGSVIGGGWENAIEESSAHSVIAGGHTNSLASFVQYGVIGGGEWNRIHPTNTHAVIAGGGFNEARTGANYAAIGGGLGNVAGSNAAYAAIPGGFANLASGEFSFAAGNQAQANHAGAFVWADAQGRPFASTATNQFAVRAAGGVRLVTDGAGLSVDGNAGIGTPTPQAPLHIVTPGEGIRIQGQASGAPNVAWMAFVDGSETHLGYVGDGSSGDDSMYLASYVGDVILYTPAGAALTATASGEVRLGPPSSPLRATAGEENLRVIRGWVAGNGVVLEGSGFTAAHGPTTGTYTITFTTPFADRPTVTATADPVGGAGYAVMVIDSFGGGISTSSVRLQARNLDAFSFIQSHFHFIAIGPR
jgi:hypothetical protein